MTWAIHYESLTQRITASFSINTAAVSLPDPPDGHTGAFVANRPPLPGWYSDGQCIPTPPQPTPAHTWDWSSKMWLHSLAAARAQTWTRIKAARDRAEFGPFTWGSHVFDGDSESQRRIQGAAQLAAMAIAANVPWSIAWTLADNTTITMTASDMIAAGTSLAISVASAHGTARALRTQIDAASTQAELDAIQWPGPEL